MEDPELQGPVLGSEQHPEEAAGGTTEPPTAYTVHHLGVQVLAPPGKPRPAGGEDSKQNYGLASRRACGLQGLEWVLAQAPPRTLPFQASAPLHV